MSCIAVKVLKKHSIFQASIVQDRDKLFLLSWQCTAAAIYNSDKNNEREVYRSILSVFKGMIFYKLIIVVEKKSALNPRFNYVR